MAKASKTPYAEPRLLESDSAIVKQVNLVLPKAHPKQHEFITILDRMPHVRFAVGACGSKLGKAVLLSEPIPTVDGWKTMGDIEEGDYVFDVDGKPTRVEYVTDPMYGRKCYEVVFSDGSVVKVDAEHLWVTLTEDDVKMLDYHGDCKERFPDDWSVWESRESSKHRYSRKDRERIATLKASGKSCKEIADEFRTTPTAIQQQWNKPVKECSVGPHAKTRSTQEIKDTLSSKHCIPVVSSPLQFPEADLPIPAYIMGYLLGDGDTSGRGRVSTHQDDRDWLISEFRNLGYNCVKSKDDIHFFIQGITSTWVSLGLDKGKHIPEIYKKASAEQRIALIKGLHDSDGCVTSHGTYCFDNTNKQLFDDYVAVCQSVGLIVRTYKRPARVRAGTTCKESYTSTIASSIPLCELPRKLVKARHSWKREQKCRVITAVNEIQSEPVKCIRVASPRHLFLVGKACIPTHNTFGCCIAMVKYAWDNKNTTSWWGAPTYVQSKNAYSLIKQLLPINTFNDYKADLVIELLEPNGTVRSKIEFKSADNPDNMRGFGVNFFVADEAARWPYDSIISLITTLTQTRGRGFFISTPMGRGKFYEMYQLGLKVDDDGTVLVDPEKDEYPEWYSMRLPTWVNPHVTMEAIMEMKRALPDDVFRQEVEAQFLLDSAGVFRGVSNCVGGVLAPPSPGSQYVMGVDLARLKDYTVLIVVDKATRKVVYFDRFNKISWEVQYHKIIELAKRYKARVCIDSTGIGDPIVEALSRAGLDIMPYKIHSSATKQQLIDKLRVAVENQNISFPNIPILVKEMESYEYTVGTNGNVKFSAPSGGHDDCVIALALANWCADTAPFIYRYSNVRGI